MINRRHSLLFRGVLISAMALPMLVFYAIGTLGPYLVDDLNVVPGWLGYLTMSSFGLAALLSLWAGPLVSRLGARQSLVLLFLLASMAYALLGLATSFTGVMLAVAVCGIAQALSNPATNLMIANSVPPHQKASVVGMKQAGVQISALFAGLSLPGIAELLGWRAALAVLIPCGLLLALVTWKVTAGDRPTAAARFSLTRPSRILALLMVIQFCAGVALSAFITFLGVYATQQGMSSVTAGSLVAVFGVMGILARVGLTPLAGRMRDASWLLLLLLVLSAVAIGVIIQTSPDRQWTLWAGTIGMGLTAVATNAVAMSMLLQDRAFGAPATSAGMLSAAFFAGFAVGPPSFGGLSTSIWGFTGAWTALVVVLVLGSIVALVLSRCRSNGWAGEVLSQPVEGK
ncbi:MFS transporter [Halomonas huangheensis]|nr:MFS transporter [Halomonas huangheensis]